jgi:5'-nucleotidase
MNADERCLKTILVTNDDGWDAPGLGALKLLARELGRVYVLAPRDPHSYVGHRITTEAALDLVETGSGEFSLTGTPADCVRVGLTTLFPEVDWVLAGINRGGNLGADLFISGTVAAAREAAYLGTPAIAVSQYIRKGVAVDWDWSTEAALPVVQGLMEEPWVEGTYWNVNLPHLEPGATAEVVFCEPDRKRLDVRFTREGASFRYAGSYQGRLRTPGFDVDRCFEGNITVSRLVV